MLTLRGRAALVTGGSRGIGRAICTLFGRLGARVAVNFVQDEEAARETVEAVRAAGAESFAVRGDVSRPEEAEQVVQEADTRLDGLDVLVVSHGIWKRAPLDAMAPEQWEETLRINLGGAYAVCRSAARRMTPR